MGYRFFISFSDGERDPFLSVQDRYVSYAAHESHAVPATEISKIVGPRSRLIQKLMSTRIPAQQNHVEK